MVLLKMLPLAMGSEITSPQYNQAVLDLYRISCRQLLSLDDSFEMLLPAVEEDLALRAKALSDWCEGFLAGIKQSGVIVKDVIVQDILHCIKDIAELEYDKALFNDNDETAYQETLRYVRFAALLVYAEIAAQPSPYYSKYLH